MAPLQVLDRIRGCYARPVRCNEAVFRNLQSTNNVHELNQLTKFTYITRTVGVSCVCTKPNTSSSISQFICSLPVAKRPFGASCDTNTPWQQLGSSRCKFVEAQMHLMIIWSLIKQKAKKISYMLFMPCGFSAQAEREQEIQREARALICKTVRRKDS